MYTSKESLGLHNKLFEIRGRTFLKGRQVSLSLVMLLSFILQDVQYVYCIYNY